MKHLSITIILLTLFIVSCKKDNVDISPKSLLTKYNWYAYALVETFYSPNLDTVYRVQSNVLDSCYQAEHYKFYSDGKVNKYLPCYLSPKMVSGTWSLSTDSILSVSVGFASSRMTKLTSIDNMELKTNTKWPYHIYSSSAPPEFGIRSTTVVFRHR